MVKDFFAERHRRHQASPKKAFIRRLAVTSVRFRGGAFLVWFRLIRVVLLREHELPRPHDTRDFHAREIHAGYDRRSAFILKILVRIFWLRVERRRRV